MSSQGVAVVTGASQGIGRAIALRLADDGFDVAINDLPSAKESLESLAKEIAGKGKRTCIAIGNVSVELDVQNIISAVVQELGEINVMVANAGVCYALPVVDTTVEQWDRIFSINARGVFLCYKYAAIQMIKQGKGGRIVGASSVAGQRGEEYLGAYSSTKFAVRGLTQASAMEWGRHGITVNAYCPGAIETTMLEGLGAAVGSIEAFYQQCKDKSAVKHLGQTADVAALVSFLVSKEAHFVTGQSYGTNGGYLPQ